MNAPKLPCGSLRRHEAHDWAGQATEEIYHCSGVPTVTERRRAAARRLREETTGITDNWRES